MYFKPHLTLVKKETSAHSTKPSRKPLEAVSPEAILDYPPNIIHSLDFGKVLELSGDTGIPGHADNAVVYQGQIELDMRRAIACYGFHRLPLTVGELNAFIEYCSLLEVAYGSRSFDSELRSIWQETSLEDMSSRHPNLAEAFRLFLSGNLAALTRYHKDHDTLTNIGKKYVAPPHR